MVLLPPLMADWLYELPAHPHPTAVFPHRCLTTSVVTKYPKHPQTRIQTVLCSDTCRTEHSQTFTVSNQQIPSVHSLLEEFGSCALTLMDKTSIFAACIPKALSASLDSENQDY